MQDVLTSSLALAAAHAGDLDTLQALVELVSLLLRDNTNRWDMVYMGRTRSPGPHQPSKATPGCGLTY